ncbi:cysteine hydrolase family protein [Streptosporangium amethystogenes]|uniref:cysteine hydrolase family protein n=1 Tax=Streptosporangium amethystogenes TaxID=2002 RepID=UPI0037ACA107
MVSDLVCPASSPRARPTGPLTNDRRPISPLWVSGCHVNTPLEHALSRRGIGTVGPAGPVTEQCVLYRAFDAYAREFSVRVAVDGVASIHEDPAEAALRMMERNMWAELLPAGPPPLNRADAQECVGPERAVGPYRKKER